MGCTFMGCCKSSTGVTGLIAAQLTITNPFAPGQCQDLLHSTKLPTFD